MSFRFTDVNSMSSGGDEDGLADPEPPAEAAAEAEAEVDGEVGDEAVGRLTKARSPYLAVMKRNL